MLNTIPATFANAERYCNDLGSHLAAFSSADEQGEVEQYFLKLGTLYPTFYKMYWLGLRTNITAWPNFDWLLRTYPAPDDFYYTHWGSSKAAREPNNAAGNEFCAGADATLAYDGAWGWADYSCSGMWPFICRMQGEEGAASGGGSVLSRRPDEPAACHTPAATPSPPATTRADPAVYYYNSPKSGVSYLFNATPDYQAGAEAACNEFGGHLALYGSLSEQQEVERAFVYDGGMIGSYHKSYWVGLTQSESNAQQFMWLDRTLPSPSNRTYQHWEPGQPNSKIETCAVATWRTSYSGAWAWDDVSCYDLQFPYICKKSRGWQAPPTQHPAAVLLFYPIASRTH